MCGLVGMAGILGTKDISAFSEMLYADYFRGKDSVGVGSVSASGAMNTLKSLMLPSDFVEHKKYNSFVHTGARVLMGHNRAATRGGVTVHNAHPFVTDRILGAHNGTLDHQCLKDLAENQEGQTDSERLIRTISDLDGRIPDALSLASGAWALTIYDKETNTISLVRNDKRPLYYCFAESRKTLYWASEPGILIWILGRNQIKHNKVMEMPVDRVRSWVLPKPSETFGECGSEQAEGKKPINFPNNPNLRAGWADPDDYGLPWYRDQHYSAHGDSRKSSGNATGTPGSNSKRALKPDPESFDPWEPYGEGWQAFDRGQIITDCPYDWNTRSRESWVDGWGEARQDALKNTPKPAEKVVDLDSKRTKIYDRRHGPHGHPVGREEFANLVKDGCSWCGNPVPFEDKGYFHRGTGTKTPTYFCNECTSQTKKTA